MSTQGGAGSQLAALAQKSRTINKTRQALGLSQSAAGGAGSVRAPAPPPTPLAPRPADATAGAVVTPAQPADANAQQPARNPKQLQMVTDFLNQAKTQGREVAPAGPTMDSAPPIQSLPLSDQIEAAGATSYSPEMQFMRLAGRAPSGREMFVFNIAQQMTQQLGRPPTRNEVLARVTAPVDLTQGPAPVSG